MKKTAALLAALLALLLSLTSCDALLDALKQAYSSELALFSLLESEEETPGEPSGSTPTAAPTVSTPENDDPEPTTPSPATPTPTTPTPTTPTPTTPTPETPTPTPTPDGIPFKEEPVIPIYNLPRENFTDQLEREASLIIDPAIEKAIAAILVMKDDRHSTVSYAFVEDANGYASGLTANQKKLYGQIVGHAEKFEDFSITSAVHGGDALTDYLTVSKALMLNHPDIAGYLSIRPTGTLDGIRSSYFDPSADANSTVADGDVTMAQVRHDAQLLDRIVKRVVKKMPEGLTTYDKYCYLALVLCEHITYDGSAENCFSPFGALINGRCVCEGYSRAYLLLCREANLWCAYRAGSPNGSGHIWNMVKLESGVYNVDVTWCDARAPHSKNWYAYFMKSDDAFVKDGHNAKEGVKGTGSYEPSPYEK